MKGVKEARPPRRKSKEPASPPKGFRIRLTLEDEVPTIGSGYCLVTVQFRGKKVHLYHGCYVATMKRDAFKELLAANKRSRKRNPVEVDLLPADPPQVARCTTHREIDYTPNFKQTLKGDDFHIGTYPDGYPIMPACLRREPLLRLVVKNPPADTSKEAAA